MAHNARILSKFKQLPDFFDKVMETVEDFEANIVYDSEYHTNIMRRCDVCIIKPEVINVITHGKRGTQRQNFRNDVLANYAMKMIQLFSTERYYNDPEGNGMQKLLEEMCINNEGEIILSGQEAYDQVYEMSHLHGLFPLVDVHPDHQIPENKGRNLARKRCQHFPWIVCQCTPVCMEMFHLVFSRDYFNEQIRMFLCMPFGPYPNMPEREVRVEFRNVCRAWQARGFDREDANGEDGGGVDGEEEVWDEGRYHEVLREDFKDTLLQPMFTELDTMRGPHRDFANHVPGIPCSASATGRRVTFEEWMLNDASIPASFQNDVDNFIVNIREQAETLRPVVTKITTLHPDEAARGKTLESVNKDIREANVFTAKRSICASSVFTHYKGRLETGLGTEDEIACGALHVSDLSLDKQGQRLVFEFKTKLGLDGLPLNIQPTWEANKVVSNWGHGASGNNHLYSPHAVRMFYHAKFVWDNWYLFGGSLEQINRFLSIVCPDPSTGFEFTSKDATAQYLHASHLHHVECVDKLVMVQARDINWQNIIWDNPIENNGRQICGVEPLLPSLGLCKCGQTKCKPVLFKLTEKRWLEQTHLQVLHGVHGRYARQSKNEIGLDLLSQFRSAYLYNDVSEGDLPPWLGERERELRQQVDAVDAVNNGEHVVYECSNCGELHILYTDAETCCQPEEEVEEVEDEGGAEQIVITCSDDWEIAHMRDVRNAIIEVGRKPPYGAWRRIKEALVGYTLVEGSNNQALRDLVRRRHRSFNDNILVPMDEILGSDALQLLNNCQGNASTPRCRCILHNYDWDSLDANGNNEDDNNEDDNNEDDNN